MPRRLTSRRRYHADHYLFSDVAPTYSFKEPTLGAQSVRNLQRMLQEDLETAFPLANNVTPPPNSLTAVILTLAAASIPFDGDVPSADFINAVLQTGFIDDLLHALRLSCHPRPGKRHTRYHLTRVLSVLHAYVSTSDLLAKRLADNSLALPLLLTPMNWRSATDIAIPLAEEVLHASPRSVHFQLAPFTGIAEVVQALSPFQLGTMCRVLALFIDDRETTVPCTLNPDPAASAHAGCHPDWRQIEKPPDLLKARRSYLDTRGKLARERNQAALLSIPGFISKLVRIISIPPPCRDDIDVIDDALRAGFQTVDPLTTNQNNNEPTNNNNNQHNHNNVAPATVPAPVPVPVPVPAHLPVPVQLTLAVPIPTPALALTITATAMPTPATTAPAPATVTAPVLHPPSASASVSDTTAVNHPPTLPAVTAPSPVLVNNHTPTAAPNHPPNHPHPTPQPNHALAHQVGQEDDIRERILLMVFHRLTGGHQEDNRLIRSDTWPVLDSSIEEAELEWAVSGFVGRATRTRTHTPAGSHDQLFGIIQSPDAIANAVQHVAVEIGAEPGAANVVIVETDDNYASDPDAFRDVGDAVGDEVQVHIDFDEIAGQFNIQAEGVIQNVIGPIVDLSNPGDDVSSAGGNDALSDVDNTDTDNTVGDDISDAGDHVNQEVDDDAAAQQAREADEAFEKIFQEHLLSIISNVMLTHQVEALFILYTLLGGKRRADVRARLIEEGVFPALNRFFDALDWTNPSDESRTEDTLKVHLLRLIHYLCDGMDENTLVEHENHLFSDSEREVIETIEDGSWMEKYVIQSIGFFGQRGSGGDGTSKAALRLLSDRDQLVYEEAEDGAIIQTKVLHFCAVHTQCNICWCETQRRQWLEKNGTDASGKDGKEKCVEPETNINRERGLMMKIVSVLMETNGRDERSIGRRDLLSGCVEAFQRGATMAEKTFVGRQGLLQHLVDQLCCSKNLTSNLNQFRQTSFDLLGHLIKWNRELFAMMNDVLRGSHRLLTKLLDAVSSRLIDSNVFVRSVALSLERFRAEDELAMQSVQVRQASDNGQEYVCYDFGSCVLWEFIDELRVEIVYDLMASVKVDEVNYENISCVNTTLIMFVVSCKDCASLDQLLECVAEHAIEKMERKMKMHEEELVSMRCDEVIDNFIKVVDFWINYYRYQGTDVNSLEMSTNISFDRFVYIASLLQKRLPATSERVKEGRKFQC